MEIARVAWATSEDYFKAKLNKEDTWEFSEEPADMKWWQIDAFRKAPAMAGQEATLFTDYVPQVGTSSQRTLALSSLALPAVFQRNERHDNEEELRWAAIKWLDPDDKKQLMESKVVKDHNEKFLHNLRDQTEMMTMFLGSPGSGKTTLMRALIWKLDKDLRVARKITYAVMNCDNMFPREPVLILASVIFTMIEAFMKATAMGGQETNLVMDYIIKVCFEFKTGFLVSTRLDIYADIMVNDDMIKVNSDGQKKRVTTIAKISLKIAQKPAHRLLEEKFISLLQTCKNLKHLQQIQNQIITHGFQHNEYVAPKLVAACAESNSMLYAHQIFDRIPDPNVVLWNAMFKGFAENQFFSATLLLFSQMKNRDVKPNCFTFPFVLKSCGKISALREGKEVHCFVIKSGFGENPFVGTTLIYMYSGGRAIDSAYQTFAEMPVRNIVAWTSIISGYILCDDIGSARRLFDLTLERDVVLWNTMVSGYIGSGDMGAARQLFDVMPNRDVMSWNTVLIGYFNNSDFKAGERLFQEMPKKNVFSWNGLIGGYARNGRFFEVLGAFKRMLMESNVPPDDATLVTALSACARLGALDLGKWIHVYAESNGFKRNIYVGNGLIDMYAKCGSIESAVDVFNVMNSKDLITWNTIICGLAMHGRGTDALDFFSQMRNAKEKPDGITFVGILCACTHMGLVENGYSYFHSMIDEYSIVPQIEHYGCMVDLLSRAGLLNQAVDFVTKMPIEADGVIWSALLGACRIYKNVQLAELALDQLIHLEPKNPANYVMLSNIYGDLGRWEDVARLKVVMRETGVRKLPGCSLIEVNDGVVEFYSLDERHPRREEMYEALRGLMELLRSSGYEPDFEELGEVT
ncbi:hypothetical protein HHK36_001531 [Tetracentron sinense]|uniref:Pentatricopeptide repeat-containing protein n=1 Tax=Tetracentron sinense TaxID=13715 RepID=A0A834ZTL7_TETSI|nr:hypothetical protein HHK36_001531 [Tetracentron sinense]